MATKNDPFADLDYPSDPRRGSVKQSRERDAVSANTKISPTSVLLVVVGALIFLGGGLYQVVHKSTISTAMATKSVSFWIPIIVLVVGLVLAVAGMRRIKRGH